MNDRPRIVQFGSFHFDPSLQELRQRGRRVRLSLSLLKLLTLFLDRPGDLVISEQIADALWQDQSVTAIRIIDL